MLRCKRKNVLKQKEEELAVGNDSLEADIDDKKVDIRFYFLRNVEKTKFTIEK